MQRDHPVFVRTADLLKNALCLQEHNYHLALKVLQSLAVPVMFLESPLRIEDPIFCEIGRAASSWHLVQF